MDKEKPHIGEIIRLKVEERGMSKTDFANAISCCRGNVYHIFKRKHISKWKLEQIGRVLNFDFTGHIQESNTFVKNYLVIIEANEEQFQEMCLRFQVVNFYVVK